MQNKKRSYYEDNEVIDYINEDNFFRSMIEASLYMWNNPFKPFNVDDMTIHEVVEKISKKINKIYSRFLESNGVTMKFNLLNRINKKSRQTEVGEIFFTLKRIDEDIQESTNINSFKYFLGNLDTYINDFQIYDMDGIIGTINEKFYSFGMTNFENIGNTFTLKFIYEPEV